MDTRNEHPNDRIVALARANGMERTLYLGEAIGTMLVIAGDALGSIGTLARRLLVSSRSQHPGERARPKSWTA